MKPSLTILAAVMLCSALPVKALGDLQHVELTFGEVAERDFTGPGRPVILRNDGEAPVVVDRVTAGCGCVRIEWIGPVTIKPGESFETVATLDASKIEPGERVYGIAADVDGTLKGIGEVAYTYRPRLVPVARTIWMESLSGLKHMSADVRVLLDDGVKASELNLNSPPTVDAVIEPDEQGSVIVKLEYRGDSPAAFDEDRFPIEIFERDRKEDAVRIEVHIPEISVVVPQPGAILIPDLEPRRVQKRSLRLVPRDGYSLVASELQVQCDDPRVKSRLVQSDGIVEVVVEVLDSEVGVSSAILQIGHQKEDWSLSIPVTWRTHER